MPVRRTAAWIAPPVIAALAIPLIAGLASGATARHETGPTSQWSDPVALAACGEGSGAPGRASSVPPPAVGSAGQGAAGATTGDRGGFRLEPLVASSGSLEGWRLTTALPGTRPATLQLPPESAARGPVDGRIVVTADDGRRSSITIATPGGCAAQVLSWPDVVRQAVLQPGSGAVLFHAVRRAGRADLGVWRLVPGDGAAPTRVAPPLASDDPLLAQVGRVWATSLTMDDSGRWLAVQSCGAERCGTRLVNLQTHEIRRMPGEDQGALIGLNGGWAVSFRPCVGLPCELVATSLADGHERVLSRAASGASTTIIGGRFVVVAVAMEQGKAELQVIDPEDGAVRHLAAAADDLALLPAGGSPSAGIAPAPGWVGAIQLRDGTPITLNLDRLLAASEGSR